MALIELKDRKNKDIMWPVNCILPRIDEFSEILIIAKKKDGREYVKFATKIDSVFWWIGCIEALKKTMMDTSLKEEDW